MNAWFARMQAKDEISELLAFCGVDIGKRIKNSHSYELPTSIGNITIRSGYDIRLNSREMGSVEMFRKHIYTMIQRGEL